MRRWILLLILLLVPFVAGFAFFQAVPDVDILRSHYPRMRYQVREDSSVHIEVQFTQKRPPNWTALSSIPGWVQGAVVTAEDWAFYQHDGFDFNQIREAVEERVDGQDKKLRGASTLSQQLVKNLFLSQDRSWVRKAREAWLTHRLETQFSKKTILEFYLNIVEWGPNIVGIRQAAQNYFGKSPSALTPREAAYLAYLLPSPRRYSRGFYRGQISAFAHKQISRNLERMKQGGYITDVQLEFFSRQRLAFETGEFAVAADGEEGDPDVLDSTGEGLSPNMNEPSETGPDLEEESIQDTPPAIVPPENVEEEAPLDVDSPSSL